VAWNKDILQLLREVRFCLQRFEEDEDMEELETACNMLANIAEECGVQVVDVAEDEAPPSSN